MAARIPILIIVDCEPDPRQPDPREAARWTGFEKLYAFLADARPQIAATTGQPARFSWCLRMDPQIEVVYGTACWAADTYASQFLRAEAQGDELGLHVHGWRWDAPAQTWIADHGDAGWMEHCIRDSFVAFERSFHRRCDIARMGDGWFSDQTTRVLESLGVRIDLTLEPDMPATSALVAEDIATGLIPDRAGVPRRPYRPSLSDFRVPDGDAAAHLWMLPVTTGLAPLRRRGWRRLLPGRFAPAGRERVQLNLSHSRRRFAPIFEAAISQSARPYAAICARSDGGAYPRALKNIERNIRYMLRHPLTGRFAFVGPTEALAMLTER
jgi:hypothetical protein